MGDGVAVVAIFGVATAVVMVPAVVCPRRQSALRTIANGTAAALVIQNDAKVDVLLYTVSESVRCAQKVCRHAMVMPVAGCGSRGSSLLPRETLPHARHTHAVH